MLIEVFVPTAAYTLYKSFAVKNHTRILLRGDPLVDYSLNRIQLEETEPLVSVAKIQPLNVAATKGEMPSGMMIGIPGFGVTVPLESARLSSPNDTEMTFAKFVSPEKGDAVTIKRDPILLDIDSPDSTTVLETSYINTEAQFQDLAKDYSISTTSIPMFLPMKVTNLKFKSPQKVWICSNYISSDKHRIVKKIIKTHHYTPVAYAAAWVAAVSGIVLAYDTYTRRRPSKN